MEATDFTIGMRVVNRHRQSCDLVQGQRDTYKGVVLGIEAGCNGGLWVKFDGQEFRSYMVPNDLRPEK